MSEWIDCMKEGRYTCVWPKSQLIGILNRKLCNKRMKILICLLSTVICGHCYMYMYAYCLLEVAIISSHNVSS